MSLTAAASTEENVIFKKENRWKEVWRRLRKDHVAMFGFFVIGTMLFLVLIADIIVPYEKAITMNVRERLIPPSSTHWFGTDGFGRDLMARCLHGARVSLFIGFATSFAALAFGSILGAIVGYIGGRLDNLIMRTMDIINAIPDILFAMAMVAALGPGVINICIAIALNYLPGFLRIVRSAVLNIAEQEYIEAARAGGASTMHIIFRHVLPNTVGILIVQTTANVASIILIAAT